MSSPSPDRAAQERHYRSIFESSLDAILLIDPSDGRVVDANRAALRIYDNDALIGSSLMDVSIDQGKTRERLDRVMHDGAYRFDNVQRLHNGRELHIEVNATATTFDGRPAILSSACWPRAR